MVTLQELEQWVSGALRAQGASALQADSTARALVSAEAQGLASHGLSRVPMYVSHIRAGRVLPRAEPAIVSERASAVLVDAGDGFAFPACDLAVRTAIQKAGHTGIAIGAVCNSHHFGVAAYHLEAVAAAGMVGLAFGNSPAAMPSAGGRRAIFGTNPIAAAFPRANAPAVMIDLSLSEVARGKLMVAAKKGESIPLGWALDKDGQPTTDAQAGLQGSMLPFGSGQGGTKGAMLALMVELLVITLTGARFGLEADSFFEEKGNQPRIGQVFLVVDPGALAGSAVYAERIEALISAMLVDIGVRIPGHRRHELARRAAEQGIDVAPAVLQPVRDLLAANGPDR